MRKGEGNAHSRSSSCIDMLFISPQDRNKTYKDYLTTPVIVVDVEGLSDFVFFSREKHRFCTGCGPQSDFTPFITSFFIPHRPAFVPTLLETGTSIACQECVLLLHFSYNLVYLQWSRTKRVKSANEVTE